jgi:hypothetical protein
MEKIKFSHIFNDDLERVYEGFKEVVDKLIVENQKLISNIKFHKGNDFDEKNAEFSLCWKNYYQFILIVDNVIITPYFRSIVYRTISIDKLPILITFNFNFYWDSINEKTIFIIELEYQDKFFTDLIKNDFSDEDKMNICKIMENHLSISLKGLDSGYSCVLNASMDQIRKYILFPKLFFQIISKEMIFVLNEQEIGIDRRYEIFARDANSFENILLTELIIENLIITEKFIKVGYTTYKKVSFPDIKFILVLKELANKTIFYTFIVKPNEPVEFDANRKLIKFWKKRMFDFYNFFEKGVKKEGKA